MRQVTKDLTDDFKILKKGYDFMGYDIQKKDITYHHLIVPAREGGPYSYYNGVILNGKTAHPYLHIIEYFEPRTFYYLTSEMLDEKTQREITISSLKRIREMLLEFEYKYQNRYTRKGKPIVKEEYTTKRIKL